MIVQRKQRGRHETRRGTIYLMVMASVVIVVTLGLTGMTLVRVQRRAAEGGIDMVDARAAAVSAVEHATTVMELTPTWRADAAAAGGCIGDFAFGRGRMKAEVTDPMDGDLLDSDAEAVDLLGIGSVGNAVQMYNVRLTPRSIALSSLGLGIAVKGTVSLINATILGTAGAHADGTIVAATSRVYVPVASGATVGGSTFYGATLVGVAKRQFPDSTVFSSYVSRGREITSVGMSNRRIENVVISPTINPYGSASATGVYWLDCKGDDYTIRNCRIVGTLVLLNCTGNVIVEGSVSWEPAAAGMPALVAQGKIQFAGTVAPLKEVTINFNLNPTGVPYAGATNATKTDSYPSKIKGLVYVSGDTTIVGEAIIDGALVVGGNLTVDGTAGAGAGSLSVLYDDAVTYAVPPGFSSSTVMTLVPGSFAQAVN